MSWTMSVSTGEWVLVTGRRYAPDPGPLETRVSSGALEVPGLQSTYLSPISDWGRIAQNALAWNGMNPRLSISSVTAALLSVPPVHGALRATHTSREVIVPTGAPAIRTSSPWTANAASSKIARTWYGFPAPLDAPVRRIKPAASPHRAARVVA